MTAEGLLMFGNKLHTPEYTLAGDEVAVIETSQGTIRVRLDGEGAPIHVANFCELSTMGFYDGLKFHRYVPGFVIQGGCPNTRDMTRDEVARGLDALAADAHDGIAIELGKLLLVVEDLIHTFLSPGDVSPGTVMTCILRPGGAGDYSRNGFVTHPCQMP